MTIFEYIRLSSEDDDLKEGEKPESNSIANQRNLINTYIQSHEKFAGADVVEFCDDGWSGKSFERPAVKEMLEQVRLGKAQCIIVKDISRLRIPSFLLFQGQPTQTNSQANPHSFP